MEQRLSLVTLGVSNLNRSREFYERLGWSASASSTDDVVFFQLGGLVLGLYAREALAEDAQIDAAGSGFGGIALAYNGRSREDVDAVLAEAQNAGARILKPARDVFWGGYSGYFADRDGHPWEVAWNPGMTITESGQAMLPD
ncbi:Glyoxalase-like domain protein [Maioricimonas rarisocia]|uniref:Glyoxalase-like domain protein n=1 Tax=Maioricimonas rarisocia TaxID=2528026 RepID=A0A517Z4F7_9PLAN|nr:VOC family protein [Maioricimonas rarisocia]QDU37370.1 Glyoxalase-like domain protein [Maioricimonas rarisocia]